MQIILKTVLRGSEKAGFDGKCMIPRGPPFSTAFPTCVFNLYFVMSMKSDKTVKSPEVGIRVNAFINSCKAGWGFPMAI